MATHSVKAQRHPPDRLRPVDVADVIAEFWTEVGANTTIVREDYGSTIVPRMRDRVQYRPILKNGDVNSNQFPLDWPYPPVDSSISRPGWGVGFESPVLAENHLQIRASDNVTFREQMHLETADYVFYWQLYNGVIQLPRGVITSGRIKSWTNPPSQLARLSGAVAPEFIVLRK